MKSYSCCCHWRCSWGCFTEITYELTSPLPVYFFYRDIILALYLNAYLISCRVHCLCSWTANLLFKLKLIVLMDLFVWSFNRSKQILFCVCYDGCKLNCDILLNFNYWIRPVFNWLFHETRVFLMLMLYIE